MSPDIAGHNSPSGLIIVIIIIDQHSSIAARPDNRYVYSALRVFAEEEPAMPEICQETAVSEMPGAARDFGARAAGNMV